MSTTVNATGIEFMSNDAYELQSTKEMSKVYCVPAPPMVIETWTDGASWYRKYSDGWIEQGGQMSTTATSTTSVTVTFPKAFSTTNYFIARTNYTNTTSTLASNFYAFWSKTTASAKTNYTSTTTFMWYACGY